MAKVGLTTHPMQNLMRNMVGTLFLFCGGLMMSKSRILDGPQAGISIWGESRFGGKFELQICHLPEILLLEKFLAGAIFASHTL